MFCRTLPSQPLPASSFFFFKSGTALINHLSDLNGIIMIPWPPPPAVYQAACIRHTSQWISSYFKFRLFSSHFLAFLSFLSPLNSPIIIHLPLQPEIPSLKEAANFFHTRGLNNVKVLPSSRWRYLISYIKGGLFHSKKYGTFCSTIYYVYVYLLINKVQTGCCISQRPGSGEWELWVKAISCFLTLWSRLSDLLEP